MLIVNNINRHSLFRLIVGHTAKVFYYLFHLKGVESRTINRKIWEGHQAIGIIIACCHQFTGCFIQLKSKLSVLQTATNQGLLSGQTNLGRLGSVAVVEDRWLGGHVGLQETIRASSYFDGNIFALQVEGHTPILGVHFSDGVVIGPCPLQLNS